MYEPMAVGVPVIAPVAALSVSPTGSVPRLIDQVKGEAPPCCKIVAEYGALTTPDERLVVEIVNTATTLIEYVCVAVCAGLPLSVALTVNWLEPTEVGLPAITPVADASVNPAGSAPEVTAQVYGVVPLAAANVAEYATPITAPGNAAVVIASEALMTIDND